jgi:IS30 family transposase
MANQLKMADVDTILTLHRRGWSIRRIASVLGIHRDTVARQVHQANQAEAPTGSPEGKLDTMRGGLGERGRRTV